MEQQLEAKLRFQLIKGTKDATEERAMTERNVDEWKRAIIDVWFESQDVKYLFDEFCDGSVTMEDAILFRGEYREFLREWHHDLRGYSAEEHGTALYNSRERNSHVSCYIENEG